jgi:hypothetical protein
MIVLVWNLQQVKISGEMGVGCVCVCVCVCARVHVHAHMCVNLVYYINNCSH